MSSLPRQASWALRLTVGVPLLLVALLAVVTTLAGCSTPVDRVSGEDRIEVDWSEVKSGQDLVAEGQVPTTRPPAPAPLPEHTPAQGTSRAVIGTTTTTVAPALAELDVLLAQLVVEAEAPRDGYDREERFGGWRTRNGCTTRNAVLIDESLVEPVIEGRCKVVSGEWVSAYDGETTTVPRDLDIDHMVPLAEAWDSGAWAWDDDKRRDYANDLAHPEHLIAVSDSSNRSKGDQDPAEWFQVRAEFRCEYVEAWIGVKLRWELTVDPAEHRALEGVAGSCAN